MGPGPGRFTTRRDSTARSRSCTQVDTSVAPCIVAHSSRVVVFILGAHCTALHSLSQRRTAIGVHTLSRSRRLAPVCDPQPLRSVGSPRTAGSVTTVCVSSHATRCTDNTSHAQPSKTLCDVCVCTASIADGAVHLCGQPQGAVCLCRRARGCWRERTPSASPSASDRLPQP